MNPQEKYSNEVTVKNQTKINTYKRGIFTIAEKDGKFHILVQNYIVSEKTFDKLEKAEKYINSKPWELIINVTSLTLKLVQQHEKSKS